MTEIGREAGIKISHHDDPRMNGNIIADSADAEEPVKNSIVLPASCFSDYFGSCHMDTFSFETVESVTDKSVDSE